MQHSVLGHTGLAVSRLAFGTRPGVTSVLLRSTELADPPLAQALSAPSAGPAASGGTGHREAVLGRKRR